MVAQLQRIPVKSMDTSTQPDADRLRLEAEIAALRRELEELTRSLPRHSLKPLHLLRIEELEQAIAEKEAALARLKP